MMVENLKEVEEPSRIREETLEEEKKKDDSVEVDDVEEMSGSQEKPC